MKTEVVQLVHAVLVLVFGGAAEELLPKFQGVGFPVLLAAALFTAARRPALPALLFAVAAGALEDALSGLPAATGAGFFALAGLVCRVPYLALPAQLLAYPAFQLWLWLWLAALGGGVFSRLLVALPMGCLTALAAFPALVWLERKAVLDER